MAGCRAKAFKAALVSTIPVLTGYLVLGFGFGIILKANGYSILLAFAICCSCRLYFKWVDEV